MKLYITPTSPYARMARIVVLEKGLSDRVEVVEARTRETDSPYYAINPSGRVPYLLREDGNGIEESALVCAWLDHLDGAPRFDRPSGDTGWEARRLEALGRSLMDGIAVWSRELRRPANEQSPGVVEHERQRGRRLTDLWESEIDSPLMHGPLNMAQITLVSALQLDSRIAALNPDGAPGFDWRADHPNLVAWVARLGERPSIAATVP